LHIGISKAHCNLAVNLIKKFSKGDKNAFRQVFDTYFNALCAFGYNYIREASAVEDLVQEAFISLWEKHRDFDNINALKSFLYTTVRNKCLNHLKHQLVRQKNEDALISVLESEHYFEGKVIEEEVFNQLTLEIKNLPDSAQKIMLLALNGLSNSEIAAELNISVNTVKTQKKIAYSKLKDRLSPVLQSILLSL
jgi:RNA polymerase sigma-70 factor (family 1)